MFNVQCLVFNWYPVICLGPPMSIFPKFGLVWTSWIPMVFTAHPPYPFLLIPPSHSCHCEPAVSMSICAGLGCHVTCQESQSWDARRQRSQSFLRSCCLHWNPGPYRSQWCADRFPSPLFSPSEYFPRTWRIPIISRWKAVQNHHFVVPSLDKWPKPRCGDPPEQELETRKAPLSQFPLLPKVAHVSQARNHADHRKNLRRNHKELGDCTNNNGKSQVIWRI